MNRTRLPGWALGLAALALAAACAAPADETWVRIIGISVSDAGTDSDGTTPPSAGSGVIESDLHDGKTDTVDVTVQNSTVILGSSGEGVSVTVYEARVEYFVENQNLPSHQYVVTLFLSPPGEGDGEVSSSTAVLQDLPLVPAAVKKWVLDPANFPADLASAGFSGEARITLRARTEEGRELETSSGIAVVFN